MAIDQGTETLAITTQERTWRINIETPKGGDAVVTVHREKVRTYPDGTVISREMVAEVRRSLSATAAQQITLGGNTYTVAEIAGVISAIADAWREEDIANTKERIDNAKLLDQ